MRSRLAVLGFAFSCLAFQGTLAQEKVSIPSFTPASPVAFLKHEGPALTVTGSLYLPTGVTGRLPAMILKHGSGGVEGPTGTNIREWAAAIASWGVAALVVDSFGPRGITETATSQARARALGRGRRQLCRVEGAGCRRPHRPHAHRHHGLVARRIERHEHHP